MISDNFRKYSRWNGKGRLIDKDMDTLIHVISKVHTLKKPIRFWATPDSKSSWEVFHQLGVDFVNTDNTKAVSAYFENAQTSRYFSPNGHTVDFSENATFGKVKYIKLIVKDLGIGIAEKEIKKILTPFYRGKNALSIKGSGIGLSLSSKIIDLHHGSISIHSELNKGTIVTVSIPQKIA